MMLDARGEQRPSAWVIVLGDLAQCRIGARDGATRADMARDLVPLVSHRLSPSEFRQALDESLAALELDGLAVSSRGRYRLTQAGSRAAATFLDCGTLEENWPEIRDLQLTIRALGVSRWPATRRKLLARPDGLRMAIVQKAFGLKLRRTPTPSRVRAELAGIALKRAFGNKLDPDFAVDGGVDANASRTLAGRLARRPREFDSDSRLIAALAAEAIDAAQSDPATLRLVLIRRFVSQLAEAATGDEEGSGEATSASAVDTIGAEDDALRALTDSLAASLTDRPGLGEFAQSVKTAAEACAQGWTGSRKAFISHVWEIVRERFPQWQLSEIEFKSMLTEAHRAGRIALASADLKTGAEVDDLMRSAITYKNTVWHHVRVDS